MALVSSKPSANPDTSATNQNTPVTIDVLANDTPNGGNKTLFSLNLGGTVGKSKLGASIKIVNGKVVYDPSGDPAIAALAAGQTETDTFIYTMTNGNKQYSATVTVTLTGLNDPPVITGQGQSTTTDVTPTNPFANSSVTDIDNGAQDSLIITLTDKNGNLTDADGKLSGQGLTQTGVGTYSLGATSPVLLTSELNNLTFTPTAHQGAAGTTITTKFTATASDGMATVQNVLTTVATTQTAEPPPTQIIGYGTTLITVPPAGSSIGQGSLATDINNSGEIVGFYTRASSQEFGFTDINGVFNTVLFPGSNDTLIQSLNNQGDYGGVYGANVSNQTAYVFHNGLYQTINTNNGAAGTEDQVVAMNDHSQVVVESNFFQNGWIYNDDTGILTPVTPLNSSDTIQMGDINNNGIAVGSEVAAGNVFAGFIYDSATGAREEFNMVGGHNTTVNGINDKNQIVGAFEDSSDVLHGFIAQYDQATATVDTLNFTDLGPVDPFRINNNGAVISSNNTSGHSFVYAGAQTLNQNLDITPNGSSYLAFAINDSDVVAGQLGTGTDKLPVYSTPIRA
jgi:VCBS repeat-containing protein